MTKKWRVSASESIWLAWSQLHLGRFVNSWRRRSFVQRPARWEGLIPTVGMIRERQQMSKGHAHTTASRGPRATSNNGKERVTGARPFSSSVIWCLDVKFQNTLNWTGKMFGVEGHMIVSYIKLKGAFGVSFCDAFCVTMNEMFGIMRESALWYKMTKYPQKKCDHVMRSHSATISAHISSEWHIS